MSNATSSALPESGNKPGKVSRILQRIDALALAALAVTQVLVWPLFYGACLGGGLWWAFHPEHASGLAGNQVPMELRKSAARWVITATFALLTVLFGFALRSRWRTGDWNWRIVSSRFARLLCLAVAVPIVVFIGRQGTEISYSMLLIFSALFIGGLVALTLYTGSPTRERAPTPLLARLLPPVVLFILAGAYVVFFSKMAIITHHGLRTWTFDLALYDNIFYQSIHGRPLGCSFLKTGYHGSAHFDPLLVLLSPFYLIYPRAESIMVLEFVWVASAVVPLYLLGRQRLLGPYQALVLPAMWTLYPALHGANMFDFHSLTLISTLIPWLFYFFERRSTIAYFVTFALALLTREDVSLFLCFLGVYGLLLRESWAVRVGWITIALSLVYFVVAKSVFMAAPQQALMGTPSYSFAFYYGELIPTPRGGLQEMLLSLFTNQPFVYKFVLTREKLHFLLMLLVPLWFFPLFTRHGWLFFLFGIAFCLLGTRTALFSIAFQYSAWIYPIAFALAAKGLFDVSHGRLSRWLGLEPRRLARALLMGSLATTLLLSWKFGGIVPNDAFHGGFSKPLRSLTAEDKARYAWVQEALALIPKSASASATRRLGPHISNRKTAHLYPDARRVDYLLLDEADMNPNEHKFHKKNAKDGGYKEIKRFRKLVLLKRDAS